MIKIHFTTFYLQEFHKKKFPKYTAGALFKIFFPKKLYVKSNFVTFTDLKRKNLQTQSEIRAQSLKSL